MKVYSDADIQALRAQGWDTLDTTFEPSYKSHWTMWHAIREFYQNALDEHDEVGSSVIPTLAKTDVGLLVEDQGRGVGASALLMRETKRSAGDLRGQFGEGLKFACIVALREGYDVEIGSPHFTIRPIMRERTVAGARLQLMSFLWQDRPGAARGTRIIVRGYAGPTYRERFWTLLGKELPVAAAEATEGRFRRLNEVRWQPANALFVGDIFVRSLASGDKKSPYSYNLWGVTLNPDRDAEVSVSRLYQMIAWTWRLAPRESIVPLLKQVQAGQGYEAEIGWDYSSLSELAPESQTPWRQAWEEAFGHGAVIYTIETWARYAESYGYRPVRLPHAFASYLSGVIQTDEQAVKARAGGTILWRKEVPDSKLSAADLATLAEARDLTALVAKGIGAPAPRVVAAEFSPDPATGTTFAGLWQSETSTVSLAQHLLRDARAMLETLFHELGHWHSGARDLTAEHTKGVAQVARYALEAVRAQVGTGRKEARRTATVTAGTEAGPVMRGGDLSWADLATRAKEAGIPDYERYSKVMLRRLLGLS